MINYQDYLRLRTFFETTNNNDLVFENGEVYFAPKEPKETSLETYVLKPETLQAFYLLNYARFQDTLKEYEKYPFETLPESIFSVVNNQGWFVLSLITVNDLVYAIYFLPNKQQQYAIGKYYSQIRGIHDYGYYDFETVEQCLDFINEQVKKYYGV